MFYPPTLYLIKILLELVYNGHKADLNPATHYLPKLCTQNVNFGIESQPHYLLAFLIPSLSRAMIHLQIFADPSTIV